MEKKIIQNDSAIEIKSLAELKFLNCGEAKALGPENLARWYHLRDINPLLNLTLGMSIIKTYGLDYFQMFIEKYSNSFWNYSLEDIKFIGFDQCAKRMIWRSYPPIVDLNFEENILARFEGNAQQADEFKQRIESVYEEFKNAYNGRRQRAINGGKLFGVLLLSRGEAKKTFMESLKEV